MRGIRRALMVTLIVTAAGFLGWVSVGAALRARRAGDELRSASPPACQAPAAAPKAVVDEAVHSFGILDPREKCEHAFVIRNEGEAPLVLSRGPTSCKCTMSELPGQAIAPGSGARVRVASKLTQESGEFSHSATIFTNDPDHSRLTLRMQGTIRKYLAADPPRIVLSALQRHASKSVEVTVYSQVWDEFAMEEIASTLEGLTWQVTPADPETLNALDARSGHRLEVALPENVPGGDFWHELSMSIVPSGGSAAPRDFRLDIAGTVLSRISIFGPKIDERKIVDLGFIRQGEGARERLTMKVRDEHRQLVIHRVETEPEFLHVEVTPLDCENEKRGLYRIDVKIPPDAPLADYLTQHGSIRIVSDHPKLPVVSLEVAFAVAGR